MLGSFKHSYEKVVHHTNGYFLVSVAVHADQYYCTPRCMGVNTRVRAGAPAEEDARVFKPKLYEVIKRTYTKVAVTVAGFEGACVAAP